MKPTVTKLDHLVLTVADIERTTRFYKNVLGMTAETFQPADGSTRTALKFGHQKINLHEAGLEFDPKAKMPTPGAGDLCFISDTELAVWIEHLIVQCVAVEDGPVERTGATGPLRSIYIRDPDGNLVEISNPV